MKLAVTAEVRLKDSDGKIDYYIVKNRTVPAMSVGTRGDDFHFSQMVQKLKEWHFENSKYQIGDGWKYRAIIGDASCVDEKQRWDISGVHTVVYFKLVCVRKGYANSDERFVVRRLQVVNYKQED